MHDMNENKKSMFYVASIATFVYAVASLIAAILCVIGKKKTTAAIFTALAGVTGAMGAIMAYTIGLIDCANKRKPFDYFEDYDDEPVEAIPDLDDFDDIDDDDPYEIPIDDTVDEEEFNDSESDKD